MPDQASAGLEEPLLETRQQPALDGPGEGEPVQEIPEVVRDDAQEEPHLIGREAVTGQPGPVGGFFPFLDPLLCRPTLIVEVDDRPVRPRQACDDEAHAGKSSQGWCSTLAMTRRGRSQDAA